MRTSDSTREVIQRYLDALADNQPAERIAVLFSTDCDYDVPGDKSAAWWVGQRVGREGIASFYSEMREALEAVAFNIEAILVEEDRGVVIGDFTSRVRPTGKTFYSPFMIHMVVHDGLVSRYLFLEDSAAAREAAVA